MKLPLTKDKKSGAVVHWTEASPFVENSRAVLIHRPRHVGTYKIGDKWKAHIAMKCWCGTSFSGSKKFTFLNAPPEGKLLCARCEEIATSFGQPSAAALVGHHVHIGKVEAVRLCCNGEKT